MKIITALSILICLSFGSFAQHSLVLKSGEKMSGQVKSLNEGVVKFLFKGNEMSFKVSEISSIQFDGAAPAASSTTSSTKGVTYVMAGRKMTKEPKIDNLTMEKGVVVVEINTEML